MFTDQTPGWWENAPSTSRDFSPGAPDPPGEIIRIDDSDLDDNPDRLLIELQTVSMFGDAKVVRTTLGRRINGALLKTALEDRPLACDLVVEGGNLKASDGARKAFEATSWAAAVPCYPDSERDLAGMVRDIVQENDFKIASDALELLISRIGADRALSRGEVEKLLLYVGSPREITTSDVEAIVGDASEMAIDTIVSCAADGRAALAVRELDRSVAAGESPQVVIGALQRHFRRLHRLRCALDAGKLFDDAARTLRPPIFFKQKDAVAAQCRRWTAGRLTTAMARIGETAGKARRNSQLELVLAERLVLELATMAGRKT